VSNPVHDSINGNMLGARLDCQSHHGLGLGEGLGLGLGEGDGLGLGLGEADGEIFARGWI